MTPPENAAPVPPEWQWANERYFDMLDDRDRWRKRYIKCRDQLTFSRWLIIAASMVAVVGWLGWLR